jgi:plastocyanin
MLHRPLRALAAAAVVALVLAGCGGDDEPSADGPPDDCTPIEDGAFTMVAENISWNVECLQVEVGTEITFTVDNRDRGVGHNLSVFGPSGEAKTDIETGPVTQTLVYEASEEGYHQFACDPHAAMEGQLWVVPAG